MRGYVDTDWGQLHYRSSGPAVSEGGPVAVLFHESPRSSLVYEPIMKPLGEHLTAFAFDTPGFGLSDSAPAGSGIPDYGRILLQAIDALGIGDFTAVGMKTGSTLATQVATLAGSGRVAAAVLYSLSLPDPEADEYWAENWAPDLTVTEDGSLFEYFWKKNVGLYGTDSPRDLSLCVAEAVVNLERYNSIYPAVFRYGSTVYELNQKLIADGVALTVIHAPSAQMTPDAPLEFFHMPGTRDVFMPVSGQFGSRSPKEFVDAIVAVAA
ncbi:alpha/beta fold hydrolase [Subtercola boreus]|uniref:AB hydrolase-1 domain-containing protein n=1 Tax=Subtercola boreus TaxID=120213 RepID=A0A3E0W817_9MICO|nr:alpha/beta fold hydrolase [Subtercola boreus]RFA19272.1 hypothetical protein B7R24_11470 [Subtercola boreus]RFA19532.1 hypothetical protein B7R23_11450 [Subtercola boreus]RFA25898.1 hypothetical protein B7R25_11570 [Subtercola boreus]